jgi:MOSC domain-containing protein YiiM
MGILLGIYIADRKGRPMRSLGEAQLVSGQGIVGDRTFSAKVQDPSREVTLIEIEQVEDFNSAYGMALKPEDLRRNLVTEGIGLNDLVGFEFAVGSVVLRGIRLCEPCKYLASLTHHDVVRGLKHRAGLRAGIVQGGVVKLHDTVDVRKVVHEIHD